MLSSSRLRALVPPRTVTVKGRVQAVQPLISTADIQRRVRDAARYIDDLPRLYGEPVVVCVERGARPLYDDIVRRLRRPIIRRSLRYASYEGTESGQGEWIKRPGDLRGRHVILVEDIVDTGKAITAMVAECLAAGAVQVDVVTLLHKPANDRSGFPLAWVGFEIGPEFVIGYGLDYNGRYRRLPAIYRVVPRGTPPLSSGVAALVRSLPVQTGPASRR